MLLVSSTAIVNAAWSVDNASSVEESSGVSDQVAHPADSHGYGDRPLVDNVIPTGNFEEWLSASQPRDWGVIASPTRRTAFNYTAETHSGMYSAWMLTRGTLSASMNILSQTYTSQIPGAPLLSGRLYLEYWWKVTSVPQPIVGGVHWMVVLISRSGLEYGLTYHLLFNQVGDSNSSQYGYLLLNSTINTWNRFGRNVTYDFEQVFGIPVADARITSVWFYASYTPSSTTDPVEILIDDYSLRDYTLTEYAMNGGFESGTDAGWYTYEQSDPGSIRQSTMRVQGEFAMNMTAAISGGTSSSVLVSKDFGYLYGYFPTAGNVGHLKLWYWYGDTRPAAGTAFAYLQISFRNSTYQVNVGMYFGASSEDVIPGNYSSPTYAAFNIRAPNFDRREVWNYVSLNMSQLLATAGATTGFLTSIRCYVFCSTPRVDHATLILDDLQYLDYHTRDPGFEQDWMPESADPQPGWLADSYPKVWRSTNAHSGQYSAGITAVSELNIIYTSMELHRSRSVFFGLNYLVNSIPPSPEALQAIALSSVDAGKSVGYVLSTDDKSRYANGTSTYYFVAPTYNQTGTWLGIMRNVTEDYRVAFGDHAWRAGVVYLVVWSSTSSAAQVLFDDVHFYDREPPTILSVERLTSVPVYDEPVR
ncbi:MAG: hypothetical protein QXQ81_08465, partial [Candidatus Thorarchaeota archaeon]